MFGRPIPEGAKGFQELLAGRCHRVFDPWRHLVIALPVHDTMALQLLGV
jgi:hypothetical protein